MLMTGYKSQSLIRYLPRLILAFVFSQNSLASEETCSRFYEDHQYPGQAFTLCSDNIDVQEFYGGQDFSDDMITSIQLAPGHRAYASIRY